MSVFKSLPLPFIAVLAACQGEQQSAPSNQVMENFVNSLETQEEAANAVAVTEARGRERQRARAAEQRLDKLE